MISVEAYINALKCWGIEIKFSGYTKPPKNAKKKKKRYYRISYIIYGEEFIIEEQDQLQAYREALNVLEENARKNHWLPLNP